MSYTDVRRKVFISYHHGDQAREVRNRWPEWELAYIVEALVLARSGRNHEASALVQTARELLQPSHETLLGEVAAGIAAGKPQLVSVIKLT